METSGTFNEKRHVIRIESKRHIGKQCIIYLTIMCRWIVEQVLGAIEKKCTKCYKGCNCVGTEDKNEEGCLLLLGSEVNPHYVAHISGFVFAVQLVRSKNMLIAFLC